MSTRGATSRAAHDNATSFRPDIEGLRGIAILLVVAYHAGVPFFSGGFIGVDVFFVLSGYLITGLLLAEIARTGTIDFMGFYARRVRRLLPASALTIVVTAVAGAFVFSPSEHVLFSQTAFATALYVSNVWFLRQSADYFAPELEGNPLLHTWSLGVEEQFYAFWPLLIFTVHRVGRRREWLAVAMGGLAVLSLTIALWVGRSNRMWAFYMLPGRSWEFAVGALACLASTPAAARRASAARTGEWGLAAILASAVLLSPRSPFPGAWTLLPVLGTAAALIPCGAPANRLVTRALNSSLLQWTGRLSYSWYLWHWPFLVLAGAVVPGLTIVGRLVCVLAALALADFTHRVVENPIRFHPALTGRPAAALALGVLLTVGGATTGVLWEHVGWHGLRTPEQREILHARENPLGTRDGCLVGFQVATPAECTFGDGESETTVALFGDSHAAQLVPALDQAGKQRHWRVVTLLKGGCPAADVPIYNPRLRRVEGECTAWRSAALDRLAALQPSAVVVSSALSYVKGPGRDDGYAQLTYGQWQEGVRRTLQHLDRAAIPTLLVHDTPHPGLDVPTCLARAEWHGENAGSGCAVARQLAVDVRGIDAERGAAGGLRHVALLDLSNLFCGPARCPATSEGVVVYRDSNHISTAFSLTLAPSLSQALGPLVAPGLGSSQSGS